jgi:hypothetical protein
MLLIDTREHPQAIAKIIAHMKQNNIPYTMCKLDVGDYMLSDKDGVSVDRKKDLGEMLTNLCSKDSSRFWREIRRAHERKIKLFILCEHGGAIKSIEDVKHWQSKYSRVSGKTLAERMYRAHIAYGVEFLFCDKRSTGKRIIEILTTYEREKRNG